MAKKTREEIKSEFKNGMKPNEENFADLIDSSVNFLDDGVSWNNGKLGVKTNDPKASLHVYDEGGDYVMPGASIEPTVMIGKEDGPYLAIDNNEVAAKNNGSKADLHFQKDGGDIRFFEPDSAAEISFKDSGKLGIGTNAPEEELHIRSATPTVKIESSDDDQESTLTLSDSEGKGASLVYDSATIEQNFQIRLRSGDGEDPVTVAQFVNSTHNNRRGWLGLLRPEILGVQAPLHINSEHQFDEDALVYENGAFLIGTMQADSINLSMDTNNIECRKKNSGTGFSASTLHLQKSGGAIRYYGSFGSGSDQKLKKDIKPLGKGLKEILKLKPVSFKWKSSPESGANFGFIAQDVEKVIKEVVSDDGYDKTKTVAYLEIIPVLTNAIQEQQSQIETLEQRIQKLEKLMAKK
jgi:hypothetical protein